ncbi:MAG: hypothetical protein IKH51_01945, partial [Clostridia bacterium]|nr:hypothetical protein [Clostridia bacterium]
AGALPANARFRIYTVDSEEYRGAVEQAIGEKTAEIRAVDLAFVDKNGDEITPRLPVSVSVTLTGMDEAEELSVVHFDDVGNADVLYPGTPEVVKMRGGNDRMEFTFETESFSVFAIAGIIKAQIVASDGNTYEITLAYGADAEIPSDAYLSVTEVMEGTPEYEALCAAIGLTVNGAAVSEEAAAEDAAQADTKASDTEDIQTEATEGEVSEDSAAQTEAEPAPAAANGVLAQLTEGVANGRFFDIKIMDASGETEIKPAAPVKVTIDLYKPLSENVSETGMQAVHFGAAGADLVNTLVVSDTAVSFDAASFSIYGVVTIETESGVFTFEDEEHVVTISYTKEAALKPGTIMTVREIEKDSSEYWDLWFMTEQKLNEGLEWFSDGPDPDPRRSLTDAAFFDITFTYEGREVEPAIPVQVNIRYKNEGIIAPAGQRAGAVHIDGNEVDIIDGVEAQYGACDAETQSYYEGGASRADSYTYMQEGFSITGTFTTGDYLDPDATRFSTSYPVFADTKARLEAAASNGAVLRAADGSDIPRPASSKKLTSNGDGTYTLSLSVTGKAQT